MRLSQLRFSEVSEMTRFSQSRPSSEAEEDEEAAAEA